MKNHLKLLAFALLTVSGVCGAQQAYVLPPGTNQKGEIIPREKLFFVLYTNEKCDLPIVHAKDMRKAVAYGVVPPDVGCWGRTLSADKESIVIVGAAGDTIRESLGNFSGAELRSDGAAVITSPSRGLQEMQRRFPANR